MEDAVGRALFHHLAAIHDHDPVGHLGDDAHVVGDEDHGHAHLVLQQSDQRQYLCLDGDVERGRGLVGDEQARLARERHRDHDPLPHAAGQLVRIAAEDLRRFGNANLIEHAERLAIGRCGARP